MKIRNGEWFDAEREGLCVFEIPKSGPPSATGQQLWALPLSAKSADINFAVEGVITRLGFDL